MSPSARPTRRAIGRSALALLAAGVALPQEADEPQKEKKRRARALFVSHGAPSLAVELERAKDLVRWGTELARPSSIVVVSAHWERTPVTIGTLVKRPLVHDYGGFGPEVQAVTYDAEVAAEVGNGLARDLGLHLGLADGAIARDPKRGFDHGVWVPLVHLFPERDVPVVQLSLASRSTPTDLLGIGRALDEVLPDDVLVIGSGGLVHNLRRLDWQETSAPPAWATDFQDWALATLHAHDLDALADFERRAPALAEAHPTREHWLPVLVAAALGEGAPRVAVDGFEYGSLSRVSLEYGLRKGRR